MLGRRFQVRAPVNLLQRKLDRLPDSELSGLGCGNCLRRISDRTVPFCGSGFSYALELRMQTFPYLLASDRNAEIVSPVPMHVEVCHIGLAPRLTLVCGGLHAFPVVFTGDAENRCEIVNENHFRFSVKASLAQW